MRPHDRAARVSGKAQSAGLDDLGSKPDLDIMDIIHDIPAIQVMGSWGGLSLDLPAGSSIETQTDLKRYLQDMGAALGWSEPKVLAHSDKLGQIFDMPGDAAAEFAFQFNVAADEQRHSDEQNESAGKMIRIRKSDLRQILREVVAQENPDVAIRKTDKLSEEELTNMTPLEWTQMRNSESKARMVATPDLFVGMLRNDTKWLAHYNTAADLVKELALSAISDIVKDERGTRPDLSVYRGMSVEELRDAESDALESLERSSAHEEEEGDDFFSDREANPHDDSMYGEPEGGYEDTPTRQHSRRFEGKMRIKKSQLRRIIREERARLNESDVLTPEQMIAQYKEDSWSWRRARNDFYNFAEGADPDGIRDTYYSDGGTGPGGSWTIQDFKDVIMGVDGYLEEFE